MAIVYQIQEFLNKKLLDLECNRKVFALNSGIPYTTIISLSKGLHSNPSLQNIVKLADYLNCSIDEVVGRDAEYIHNSDKIHYVHLDSNAIIANLQEFLQHKTNHTTDLSNLSSNLGLGYNYLYSFVYTNTKHRMLSSDTIVKLADYYKISIDQMIGRI